MGAKGPRDPLAYFPVDAAGALSVDWEELAADGLGRSGTECLGHYVHLLAFLASKTGHEVRYDPNDRADVCRMAGALGIETTDANRAERAAQTVAALLDTGRVYQSTNNGRPTIRAACIDRAAETRSHRSASGAKGASARWNGRGGGGSNVER